jgi:hypothetical protein
MSVSPNERPAARYCAHCGAALRPAARRHARFCSPAPRRAAHRAHNPDLRRVRARFLSGRTHDKSAAPYVDIVPDEKWPRMYRLKRADGSVSDMVNLTRAKDTLLALHEGVRP